VPPYETSKYHSYLTSPHSTEEGKKTDYIFPTGEGPNASASESAPVGGVAASVTINGFVCALAAALAFVMVAL
jgi:hypothetical protein